MLFRLTSQPYSGNLQRAFGHSLEAVQIVEELLTRQSLEECLCRLDQCQLHGPRRDWLNDWRNAVDSGIEEPGAGREEKTMLAITVTVGIPILIIAILIVIVLFMLMRRRRR